MNDVEKQTIVAGIREIILSHEAWYLQGLDVKMLLEVPASHLWCPGFSFHSAP